MEKKLSEKEIEKLLAKVPWLKNGSIDYSLYPIKHVVEDYCSEDEEKFRNAARILMEMSAIGRKDAMIMLFGLFEYYKNDYKKLETIVYYVPFSDNEEFSNFLFDVFDRTKSSNTTRQFLNLLLKNFRKLNRKIYVFRLHKFLDDKKYSYRMKAKFKELLEEMNEM